MKPKRSSSGYVRMLHSEDDQVMYVPDTVPGNMRELCRELSQATGVDWRVCRIKATRGTHFLHDRPFNRALAYAERPMAYAVTA